MTTTEPTTPLAIAGAHLHGEPLHGDLLALGALLLTVAPPLAIGAVALADGTSALGFVCEGYAGGDAPDISHFDGWRSYRAARTADSLNH